MKCDKCQRDAEKESNDAGRGGCFFGTIFGLLVGSLGLFAILVISGHYAR